MATKFGDRGIYLALINDKIGIGQENLLVPYGSVVTLANIPTDATYAIITVECTNASLVTESKVIRYTISGADPAIGTNTPHVTATSVGASRGHLDVFDINMAQNLHQFKVTKLENDDTVYLTVQYYS